MRLIGMQEGQGSGRPGGYYRLPAVNWLQIVAGLILPIICLILAALLCSCDKGAGPEAAGPDELPVHGGTLRLLLGRTCAPDPADCADLSGAAVPAQIFEGLVDLDADMGIRPCLADSWVISPDGILHTFLLRRGVLFHDGRPLTPEAVVHSLHRAVQCASDGSSCLLSIEGAEEFRQGAADQVRGIEALGHDTVRVRLSAPDPRLLPALATVRLWIASPAECDEHGSRWAGTGPFRLARMPDDGSVHLARNDEYWGGRARLDSLVFIDSSQMSGEEKLARMLRREAHVMEGGAREQEILVDQAGYQLLRDPAPGAGPQSMPSLGTAGFIADPRLRGLRRSPAGLWFTRFHLAWLSGGEGLADGSSGGDAP